MDSSELNKIVPETEDSNHGYVPLGDVLKPDPVDDKPAVQIFQFPAPSDSKLKVSLSQEQLRIKKNATVVASDSNNEQPKSSKDKLLRRVSLQSPIEQRVIKKPATNKSINPKESSNNPKDLSLKINCGLCAKPFVDARVLACLHSFCLTCIQKRMDVDSDAPRKSNPKPRPIAIITRISNYFPVTEKSSTSGTISSQSGELPSLPPPPQRLASVSRRTSQKSFSSVTTSASKPRSSILVASTRNPICPICGAATSLPIGGISRLPKHTILNRLVDSYSSVYGVPRETCDNCDSSPSNAINNCQDCSVNLCLPCSECHKKQKITSGHKLVKLADTKKSADKDSKKASRRCPFHSNSDLKFFCTNCTQVACSECSTILHNGHKCESIHKTIKIYSKLLNDSIKKVRTVKCLKLK